MDVTLEKPELKSELLHKRAASLFFSALPSVTLPPYALKSDLFTEVNWSPEA